jgi:sodium-dependent dicarboxylate transporter 2/3/5
MPDHESVITTTAAKTDESLLRVLAFHRPAQGIAYALLAALIVLLLPTPDGLSPEGKRMMAIFVMGLILWASEAIPIAVTALLVIILQPIFRVEELRTAFTTFMSPVFFFVIAMFCIAQAIIGSGLDRRFGFWLLSRAGADSRRVVLAFMVGTASISTIMSDVPACAIFMAIAMGALAKMGASPGSSQLGKALMMGIPIASLIGGVATPAGSSVNILGIYFIEQYGHVRVPFLHWMAIGVPMVLVLVPIAWWVIVRCCPPDVESIGEVSEIHEERSNLGPLNSAEKKVMAILSVMIVLWILSTWIKQLDVALIALAGAIVMFLPGMNLLTWKEAERGTGWESLFMIGGVTSLAAASVKTGLAKWLVDVSLGGIHDWSMIWVVAVISAFTVVIHLILPIGPVVNAVLIPPIALLATASGQNPALYALPVAFTASCAFLLPLDAVPLITYSKGYYRMFDMLIPGTIISIFWVILMTLLMVVLAPMLGLL